MECLKVIKYEKPKEEKKKKQTVVKQSYVKSKPKSKYVNKKMSLDHVKATIDKRKISEQFLKN